MMIDSETIEKKFSEDKFFILVCFLIGTSLWSLKGGILLYPIDASISLYLSSFFKNEYSLVTDWAQNSWSIIHQVGSFFIHAGLRPETIARLFSLLSSLSLILGLGLILRSLRINFFLIIPLTILICLFKTLPSLSGDYLFEGIGTKINSTPNASSFFLNDKNISNGSFPETAILDQSFSQKFPLLT